MFRHKLWKRCFSFKKKDFCILLVSVDEHCKNWAEILEWIFISGCSVSAVPLCLFEGKTRVQNDSLRLCGSLGTYWQERNLSPAEENSSLLSLLFSFSGQERRIPQNQGQFSDSDHDATSESKGSLGLRPRAMTQWYMVSGGDCQRTFFGKSCIQRFYSLAQ